MNIRWVNALVKTIIVLVIGHIIFLGLGYVFPLDIGIFHLPMLWAHWTDSYTELIIGLILTIPLYLIIYFFFSMGTDEH